MKIAFYSNFLNHHQLPLCLEFVNDNNIDFTFVATEKIPQERLDMNYENMNSYPFVLRSYESDESLEKAKKLSIDADVVIIGSAPNYFVEDRLNKYNKLTFRFCERSLRKGRWRRFIPRTHRRLNSEYIQFKDKNLYILGASAYTAGDLAVCGFPKEKCFKWGYFPNVDEIEGIDEIISSKKKNSIIWVARFIECKHPEAALSIAKQLKVKGYDFTLKMIGDGPLKARSEEFVKANNLDDCVEFTGSITPELVRENMLNSQVFLFTSDFYEGWGAVVNEAMNSACMPIISHACGSAAFLIEQGQNGFIYRNGNNNEALEYVKKVFDNSNISNALGKKAYYTMVNDWNAGSSSKRLLELINRINNNEDIDYYKSGPCSKAPVYNNNWYKIYN